MKREVLFVHSAGPQGNNEGSDYLVKYLRQQLGDEFRVRNPKMPDPENPNYTTWKRGLSEALLNSDDKIILIGHSLGGSILLKYLSEEIFRKDIVGLFLVATPFWGQENWELEEFEFKSDFVSRLPPIPQIFLYHSQDDEIVEPTHIQYYFEKLPNATARKLNGYGHIFGRGLPELVMDLRNLENYG